MNSRSLSNKKEIMKKHGFSLIEVLVAFVVLGAGILGASASFSLSTRAGTRALRLRQAVELSENLIESHTSIAKQGSLQPAAGSTGVLNWKVSFENKNHGLLLIIAEVSWLEQGRARHYRLENLFSIPSS